MSNNSKVIKVIENGKEYYVLNRYNGDIVYHKDKDLAIRHRENGPAVEYCGGANFWYKDDRLHREGGSAENYPNGNKYYWLNGIQYEEEEYWAMIRFGGFV